VGAAGKSHSLALFRAVGGRLQAAMWGAMLRYNEVLLRSAAVGLVFDEAQVLFCQLRSPTRDGMSGKQRFRHPISWNYVYEGF
jgi:hypothetical protein